MATQPDTNPDSIPPEQPAPTPDEINPGRGGDMDVPDNAPSEQPGAPGVEGPGEMPGGDPAVM